MKNIEPSSRGRRTKRAQTRANPKLIGRPDYLPSLRRFLELREDFKRFIGPIASYGVVVDANVLIGELLWLSEKRKNPRAQTNLMECLVAETLTAHVARSVVVEVERNMQLLSVERGIPERVWMAHWTSYKSLLRIEELWPMAIAKYATGRHPSDAPTLALAEFAGICGILSKDLDIPAMGGKVIPIKFTLEARNYSRQAAVSVSLQIGTYYVAVSAIEVLIFAINAIKKAVQRFRTLPGWAKIIAIIAVTAAILHPKSRAMILETLRNVGAAASDAMPAIWGVLAEVVQLVEDNRAIPPIVSYV